VRLEKTLDLVAGRESNLHAEVQAMKLTAVSLCLTMDGERLEVPMNADDLAALLERSDTHRVILGKRSAPYSLGITESPDPGEGPALLLKIGDAKGFPSHVTLSGERVRLIVQGGFKAPTPMKTY
jgi:hypothetical protein